MREEPITLILCGGGGVGKGTLVRRLVDEDQRLWLSTSWTTRPRRSTEAEDAYRFVTRAEFEQAASEGRFLEWAEFLGHLYGTPIPSPGPGQDLVLDIDVQGAEQVKALQPDAVVILVLPPSREEQARRLRERGDSEESIERRLAESPAEERRARALADAVVVNDDLERATSEIATLIGQLRNGSTI